VERAAVLRDRGGAGGTGGKAPDSLSKKENKEVVLVGLMKKIHTDPFILVRERQKRKREEKMADKIKKWRVKLEFDFPDENWDQRHLTSVLNDILVAEALKSVPELTKAEITKLSLQVVLNEHYER
jgi:hypothetical protein